MLSPAERKQIAKFIGGFLIAALLLYLLGASFGWREVTRALATADLSWLGIAGLSSLVGLACWGKVWHLTLKAIGIKLSFHRILVTYLAATFANYITPLGQLGGEPLTAWVLKHDSGVDYEEGLASIVVTDLLNLIPFFGFAVIGLGILILRIDIPPTVRTVVTGLFLFSLVVPIAVYLGWRYRDRVTVATSHVLKPIASRTRKLNQEIIQNRVQNFFKAIERFDNDISVLLTVLLYAILGWVFFALPLFFVGLSVGTTIDPAVVLFVVPASTLAGFVPLPGGLAGVETALVVLLVAFLPIPGTLALAIALLYRLASYWLVILIGGISGLYLFVRGPSDNS